MMTDNDAIKLARQERPEGYQTIYEKYGSYSKKDRAVLVMAYWDDLSCKEIGDVMTIKENHVKILLFRARKRFRELWPHKPHEKEVAS